MIFIHDTRDQKGKHDNLEKWMSNNGHELIREKMNVGDVMLLGDGSICIDLKSLGLSEVYNNITHDHKRFRNECVRAMEAGVKLIILVEQEGIQSLEDVKTWHNPHFDRRRRNDEYIAFMISRGLKAEDAMPRKQPVSSERLAGMMEAMSFRYGVEWQFCNPAAVGETVFSILTAPYRKTQRFE